MISLTMSSFLAAVEAVAADRGVVAGVGWLLRSMNATQRFLMQQHAVSATRRIYHVHTQTRSLMVTHTIIYKHVQNKSGP